MFNVEEKIKEWEQLFNTGKIDKITYEKEVSKLIRKKCKKKDILYFLKAFLRIIIILIICAILIWFYKINNVTKNIEYLTNLSNIQEPIQTKALGTINKSINDSNVEMDYLARYSISGRVVDVQGYYGYNIGNRLSPRDVGISWGFLASEENYKRLKWFSAGNRYLFWHCNDEIWIRRVGGTNKINEYYSNNHLIPRDDEVEKLIKSIKKDDFIRIEGYLVNVYCKKDDKIHFWWNTSTSRSDTGDGACEIIYVYNITWLKLNK